MFQILWDTRGYFFWLLVISVGCLIAEWIRPWRRGQKLIRKEFFHDLCPAQQPERLGFPNMEQMPKLLPARFVSPLLESAKVLSRSFRSPKSHK